MGFFTKKDKKNNQKDYFSESKNAKESLGVKLKKMFGGNVLDAESLNKLEETLIQADIGPAISYELIEKIKAKNIVDIEHAIDFLKEELNNSITENPLEIIKGQLNIILVLGVNGVGKTTSIAKLSHYYLAKNYKVLLAAGDTFRAAATEQLTKWAQRLDIPIVKQGEGADPASVVYDAIDAARSKNVDLLIIDTAGRLHTKDNLMEELKKIDKIISTKGAGGKKNILVIDGTTGQNAIHQAESFKKTVGVDGIILTKYDSQSKGGIIFSIQKKLKIPFYFIGTGEKLENLLEFKKNEFIENIFS